MDPNSQASLQALAQRLQGAQAPQPPPPVQPKPFWGSDGGVGDQQNTINQAKDNSTLSDIAKETAKIQTKANADYQANDQNNNHDEKMQSLQNLHTAITASNPTSGAAETTGSVPKIDTGWHLKDLLSAIPLAIAGGLIGGPSGAILGGTYGGAGSHILGMRAQKQDILNQLAQQTANTAGVSANAQKGLEDANAASVRQDTGQSNKVFNSPATQETLNPKNTPVVARPRPKVGTKFFSPSTPGAKPAIAGSQYFKPM